MQHIEYRTIDTNAWGDGPWNSEPDKIQWPDETTGYPCLIVRNDIVGGFLCGYVGVPRGHPAYGLHYDGCDVGVHGGLTFSGPCHGDPEMESTGICHKPEPGDPDDVWWYGFDCGHAWDRSPQMEAKHPGVWLDDAVYRDVAYVTAECQSLAKQLKAMEE